ncbi:NB-ARC domain-containing protein [Roseofilum sp. Belize Diploria]|uniref:NB-ARC domain-containing protein n=1 Tax=Roseofilum sp. Belize Diploria TaxID=2821501 RepID=UPI000E94F6E6|nr:NB-ARC domain-containing protein [Roseofilum sp. Belize Diploria]MBP0007449.1 AAA family ATPase [Roseofilum sp. Belize Diploria]HBQ99339.1 AAA family ATPase [Cyanobacteria bacterium UBA11691]
MDVEPILTWADELMLAKTGTRLSSLQRAVLAGVWNHQKYKEIADEYHCGEGNVKIVAGNLWKLIAEELGEKVNKKNFRATLERYYISHSNINNLVQQPNFNQSHVNICAKNLYPREPTKQRSPSYSINQPQQRHDLTEAPEYYPLNNRSTELSTLKQWVLDEKIKIVTIFGLPRIGKTTLARALLEEVKTQFEAVIWRNCTNSLERESLEAEIIDCIGKYQTDKPTKLIHYLRSSRSLIILDDFQELFTPGELAGTYLPGCERYGKLLREIGRFHHRSCFLLLSWEKPTEIATLERENNHCLSLQLESLGGAAREILSQHQLMDEELWEELIQRYGGNPSWLNIIASTIQDFFNGSVDKFLSYPNPFLGDLEPILQDYYQRLSPSEMTVVQWLASEDTTDIFHKPKELALSHAEFLQAIHSLIKRGMLEKHTHDEVDQFTLQPTIASYIHCR